MMDDKNLFLIALFAPLIVLALVSRMPWRWRGLYAVVIAAIPVGMKVYEAIS